MPYESIPGVGAAYLDGAFASPSVSTQPKIIILGTAATGLSYRLYNVRSVAAAEKEFGSTSELMKPLHEAIAQGADNISLLRIGGTKGSVVLTESAGPSITFTPEYRDDTILDRYSVVVTTNTSSEVRVLIWDLTDEQWVYDSDEVLVVNIGIIEVDFEKLGGAAIAWSTSHTVGDINNPDDSSLTPTLAGLAGSTLWAGSPTLGGSVTTAGTDGTSMSLVERYAALEHAYSILDYRDGDMVVPCSVVADARNVTERDDYSHYTLGSGSAVWTAPSYAAVPTAGTTTGANIDALGFLWQYLYRGKVYTYFGASNTLFTAASTATITLTDRGGDTSVYPVSLTGPAQNQVSINIVDSGSVTTDSATVTVTGSVGAGWVIQVDIDGTVGTTTHTTINAAIAAHTTASTLVGAATMSTPAAANMPVQTVAAAGGAGGFLTHAQLTGDTVPAAVDQRFYDANTSGVGNGNAELRECSFAHQLATFCYRASTVWKSMLGIISLEGPSGYSREKVAEWAGQLPTLTYFGNDLGIDATSDNGDGILGSKFVGGASGYRDGVLDASTGATAADGLAYGGYILTKGTSLPNGANFVYGIADGDEALDSNDKPIDIGKHLFVTYEHPVHRNSYNGGTNYRGNFVGTLAGKFAVTPDNEEPIGINGRVRRISSPLRMKPPQMNEMARGRTIGVRREDGVGFIIVSARTAAHPTSDYARLSTIRSVNREIDGIRDIAKNYIGKEFSSTRLMSLQTAIDGFLKAEKSLGFNQGAIASLSYTRQDKIMGRLTIKLKMIPPFSIEAITIETSLAAEETELTS